MRGSVPGLTALALRALLVSLVVLGWLLPAVDRDAVERIPGHSHVFFGSPDVAAEVHAVEAARELANPGYRHLAPATEPATQLGALGASLTGLALVGFAVFYGVERTTASSREQESGKTGYVSTREAEADPDAPGTTSADVFWLSMGSFALCNALIGYLLLHREQPGLLSLGFFFIAMALHFVVNDFGLRERHKRDFTRVGRWVLVGAVVVGWLLGLFTEISKPLIAVLVAFLAGGVTSSAC